MTSDPVSAVSVKWMVHSAPNVRAWGHSSKQDFDVSISRSNVKILGKHISEFKCVGESAGKLSVRFSAPLPEPAETVEWLWKLETALTVWSGLLAGNEHYGTRYFEFDFSIPNFEWAQPRTRGQGASFGRHTEPLRDEQFRPEELATDPIRELFANGLHANSDAGKYLSWFIIIEEYLEKSKPLNAGFSPLFPQGVISALQQGVATVEMQRAISSLTSRTAEPRHRKLFEILSKLGITAVMVQGREPQPIDLAMCKRLTDGRNGLFHAGKPVDREVLYCELLPILKQIVPLSARLVQYRVKQ